MKLTTEEFEEVQEADSAIDPRYPSNWLLVEDGDWVQDGKYQHRTNIVQDLRTGLFYRYTLTRAGSPFTEWYYTYEDEDEHYLESVTQRTRTITITEWV